MVKWWRFQLWMMGVFIVGIFAGVAVAHGDMGWGFLIGIGAGTVMTFAMMDYHRR